VLSIYCRLYQGLPARQKVTLGAGLMLWAVAGMAFMPVAEEKLDLKPSAEETEKAKQAFPLFKITDMGTRSGPTDK